MVTYVRIYYWYVLGILEVTFIRLVLTRYTWIIVVSRVIGIEMSVWIDTVLDYISVPCIISNSIRYNIILLQSSISFHIETSNCFCSANQMTSFYIKCNTGLKSINPLKLYLCLLISKWITIEFQFIIC